jgi:hypothetical protein
MRAVKSPYHFGKNKCCKGSKKKSLPNREAFFMEQNSIRSKKSTIPKRVSSSDEHVALQVHPKGHNEVNDNRASKCEKRKVNEVQADFGSSNAEALAEVGTNSENLVFHKISEAVHKLFI